jgi:hypothetical protein
MLSSGVMGSFYLFAAGNDACTSKDLPICLVAVFSASTWYWKMARLSGSFHSGNMKHLLVLESHGVVENGDSLHLQAIHYDGPGFCVGSG